MNTFQWYFGALVFLLIGVQSAPSHSLDSIQPVQQQSGVVEILIRNSTFEYQAGVLRPNEASTIVLRNLDQIQHGFTSPLLEELDLRVETDDAVTFGKGIKGVHINPGGIVRFHFMAKKPSKFSFKCDLHPSMKGELLLLSVDVASR